MIEFHWQIELLYTNTKHWVIPSYRESKFTVPPMSLEEVIDLLEEHKHCQSNRDMESVAFMIRWYPDRLRIRNVITGEIIPYVLLN